MSLRILTTFVMLGLLLVFSVVQAEAAGKILFFQMGYDKASSLKGSIKVSENTFYGEGTNYGWVREGARGAGDRKLAVAKKSATAPDSISGNCVFWGGGEKPLIFRTDIPDGEYMIWIYSGMFSYNRFYDIVPFKISAGGKDELRSSAPEKFGERFFEELNDSYEYTPKWTVKTIWEKYIKKQSVSIYRLNGKSVNGYLDIKFDMPLSGYKERLKRTSANLAINAIIICPAAEMKDGENRIRAIESERHKQYIARVRLDTPRKEPPVVDVPSEFKSVGYIPFSRDLMKPVYPESIPSKNEMGKNLRMALAQGQRAILSFALHALKDIDNVTVKVSPLKDSKGNVLGSDRVKLQRVRYVIQPVDYRHHKPVYRGVPFLIMEDKPLNYIKGMNRQYIVAVTAPETAVPGVYRGTVTVMPAAAKPMVLDLQAEVYPFRLETYSDDDERIWLYHGDMGYKIYGDLLMSEEKRWQLVDKDLAFMKQQLIAPTMLFDYFASDEEIDRFMELYKKHGFRGYAVFGDYKLLKALEAYCRGGMKDKPDLSPFVDRMKYLMARKKEKNWPNIAFYTFAEIHTGMPGYLEAKEMLSRIKKEVPEAVLITLPNTLAEADVMITTQADIIGPNAVSMTESMTEKIRKANKKLWFYGWGRQRFRCGFADWRLGNRGAIKEWYTSLVRAPFNPLDGEYYDGWNDSPPLTGPDGPISTLSMEEATEGRLDFLYLATLERWMERAGEKRKPLTKKACKYGQAIIDDLRGRVVPDYSYYNQRLGTIDFKTNRFDADYEQAFGFKNGEYNTYRERIAAAIIALKYACDGYRQGAGDRSPDLTDSIRLKER